jgi:TfoX/Sxy family transcriptional regulator of competence genes
MAYDVELADRIRALAAGTPGLSEKSMFGGLAFLVRGSMAIAASGEGGVLVRVDPAESDRLVAETAATPAVMRGREMSGWLRVADDHLDDDTELAAWVGRGITYAASLPPK